MNASSLAFGCGLLLSGAVVADQTNRTGDQWVSGPVQHARLSSGQATTPSALSNFQALVQAGRLKVAWTNGGLGTNASVQVHTSVDEPGHWPARDWRVHPMFWQDGHWECSLPVIDLDVPIVYYVFVPKTEAGSPGLCSPMRVCRPRALGLAAPTALFWPFLEGFEQGLGSWRLLSAPSNAPALTTDSLAKDGLAALRVSLPSGRHSVTVATTRIRGWHFRLLGATGVRVWMRTRSGSGEARFTMFSQALTTNQVVSVSRTTAKLSEDWRKVSLFPSDFPALSAAEVDLFAIEFVGEGAQDFLVDNLELLGPWRQEPE